MHKAVQGLLGGVAHGIAEQRAQWATQYIPRSSLSSSPCTTAGETEAAKTCAWGGGDPRQARQEMRNAMTRPGEPRHMPWVRLVL